jgi:hypothetical protein
LRGLGFSGPATGYPITDTYQSTWFSIRRDEAYRTFQENGIRHLPILTGLLILTIATDSIHPGIVPHIDQMSHNSHNMGPLIPKTPIAKKLLKIPRLPLETAKSRPKRSARPAKTATTEARNL